MKKFSGWYDSYQKQQEEDKRMPYRVVKIQYDSGVPVSGLENARVEALSPAQARVLFLRKYPRLYDYINMGYKIEAEVDGEMLRQRQQLAEVEKQKKEDAIQNAWWNND